MRALTVLFLSMVLCFVATVPTLAQPTNPAPPADKANRSAGQASAGETRPAAAPEVPKPAQPAEPKAAEVPAASDKSKPTPNKTRAEQQGMDGATYVVRLRDLEQRIDELKHQIRRSHTRLSLLSDTILSGGVGGARAEIKFVNETSSAFRLTRLLVVLDGAVQYNKQDDSGALAEQKEIPIFSGSIAPGDHTLQVLVKLRGHGYGVFSYLRGYQFEVKSDHSFTVADGKTVELKMVAFEKGGVTTPLEQRPAVRYERRLRAGVLGVSSPGPSDPRRPGGASGGH
jgi:hypothetical protein